MVICLERGADLHMAQLMPLPLTVSCFSKIQIGFAFLVLAYPGSTGQRAVKRVCLCVSVCVCVSVSVSVCVGIFSVIYRLMHIHSTFSPPEPGLSNAAMVFFSLVLNENLEIDTRFFSHWIHVHDQQ